MAADTPQPTPTKPPAESSSEARRPFWGGSLRTQLLTAFMLLVLLPAVAVSIGAGITALRNGQAQAINQLESVATVKESDINTWLSSLQTNLAIMLPEQEVHVLVNTLITTPTDAEAYGKLQSHLTWMVTKSELFEEVFVMDVTGRTLLSTDVLQEQKIHINQVYFVEGLKGPYFSTPFYSPSLGRLSIVAVRPIVDTNGQVVGVLGGRASTKKLSEVMLERAGLGQTGETYLVGPNHALLTNAKSLVVDEDEALYVRTPGVNRAIDDGQSGSELYADFRNVQVVGVYHWFPRLQVALIAEQDQSEAFNSTYAILLINVGVALAAVFIAILVALAVTRSIANPLSLLAVSAAAIESGNKIDPERLKTVVARADELGQFGRIFQRMAREVYVREENLKRQVEELKIVIDEAKRERSVSEITESEFFQDLSSKAKNLRRRRTSDDTPKPEVKQE